MLHFLYGIEHIGKDISFTLYPGSYVGSRGKSPTSATVISERVSQIPHNGLLFHCSRTVLSCEMVCTSLSPSVKSLLEPNIIAYLMQ